MPDRPAVSQADAEIMEAFGDLSAERGQGVSAPLPLSSVAIESWLNLASIGSRRAHWARCLRAMDRVWLKWKMEQAADG